MLLWTTWEVVSQQNQTLSIFACSHAAAPTFNLWAELEEQEMTMAQRAWYQ